MMGFNMAWASLAIGDTVAVSNGEREPNADPTSLAHRVWRSHNFSGELVDKLDGAHRALCFDLPADADGNVIGYTVEEAVAHTFTLA